MANTVAIPINLSRLVKNPMKIIRQLSVSCMWIVAVLLSASALAQTVPVGTITYIHNDLLGSPAAATNAAGTVIWREAYSGYGERLKNEVPAASNKVWYTSRHQDEDTGLVYMGARYYDPAIGRFLAVDAVGFVETNSHSFNRYAYANNNPYRFKDPDGRNAVTAFGGLLTESYSFATGDGFNGSMVAGALRDGYNGEGAGVWRSAGEDALAFGTGALGAAVKLLRGAKAGVEAVELTAEQAKNFERFTKKLPANAEGSVNLKGLPSDGVAAQAVSPGRVPGSSAVYEKQIDATGKTIQYTKTTYDPAGNIVHVKDKITGGVFP